MGKRNRAPDRSISVTDLETVGIKLEIIETDRGLQVTGGTKGRLRFGVKELSDMLYGMGVARDNNLEVLQRTKHRTLGGKVTENYRLSGKERTDPEWLESGYATEEAKMASSRMGGMAEQLHLLRNGGE